MSALDRLEALLAEATPKFEHIHRARYERGGGRMYSHTDKALAAGKRDLILDVYNEGPREFYFTVADELPSLIARQRKLEAVAAAARELMDSYGGPGVKKDAVRSTLAALDGDA